MQIRLGPQLKVEMAGGGTIAKLLDRLIDLDECCLTDATASMQCAIDGGGTDTGGNGYIMNCRLRQGSASLLSSAILQDPDAVLSAKSENLPILTHFNHGDTPSMSHKRFTRSLNPKEKGLEPTSPDLDFRRKLKRFKRLLFQPIGPI